MSKSPDLVRAESIRSFFSPGHWLDYMVTRPLDHIRHNWELIWNTDEERYEHEESSFAGLLNELIEELATAKPPIRYHDNEDRLAEYVRDGPLRWPIAKVGSRWVGADYRVILEQGAFSDADQRDLVLASAGRIWAAIKRGQTHFDDMEDSHQRMLATVLSIILYRRA